MDWTSKVSDNFALSEFFHPIKYTDVRNKKTGKNYTAEEITAMVGDPDEVYEAIDRKLVALLEGFRAHVRKTYPYAQIVIRPHGGYRPTTLNAAVGGASGSQHRYGKAADFSVVTGNGGRMDAPTLAVQMERYMDEHGYKGGVGMYDADDNYIHVDVRGKNIAWYDSYSSAGCPGQGGRKVTYRKGQKGAGVVLIQRELTRLGYNVGTADGKYGTKTAQGVKAYQQDHGLGADGIYGAKTNAKLGVLPWT